MKKILFFFAFIALVQQIQAQVFYPVTDVRKAKSSYTVYADSSAAAPISAAQYQAVKSHPENYFLVGYRQGQAGGFLELVHKDDFVCELLTVDSIHIDEACTKVSVHFMNGKVYESKSMEWLQVLVGQKVQHFQISSKTRRFERYQAFIEVPAEFKEHLVPNFVAQREPLVVQAKPVPVQKHEPLTRGKFRFIEE